MAIGAISTIPLAFEVLGGGRASSVGEWTEELESGPWYDRRDRLTRRGAPLPT